MSDGKPSAEHRKAYLWASESKYWVKTSDRGQNGSKWRVPPNLQEKKQLNGAFKAYLRDFVKMFILKETFKNEGFPSIEGRLEAL